MLQATPNSSALIRVLILIIILKYTLPFTFKLFRNSGSKTTCTFDTKKDLTPNLVSKIVEITLNKRSTGQ